MITHSLIQGSPEWLAYRSTHFNASDAPAMLGVSPYKTRAELLRELHTGLSPDVDAATQRRFDAGHAAEAAARPLAESEIGEDLYPVVGSLEIEGLPLSASFDGLTMAENIVWEHKLMNVNLAESLADGIIPDQYAPQLEQQLLVSGATKALFMATSADRTAMECVWYTSIPEIRQQLTASWKQFAIDLKNYVPSETVAASVGRSPETLPALHIEVTGMVTASNLAVYKAHALAVFAGINRELVTDAQFADAEKTVAWCSDIESRLAAAKQHALSQTTSIDALFRAIDDISAEARATRLELDKLVSSRKDTIRAEAVLDGRNALVGHIAALNQRIGRALMPQVAHDFAGAIKGKRSVKSMADAISVELARAKIAANEVADKITLNLRAINDQADFGFLFSDVATLVLKEPEFVAMVIKNRISEHHAKEDDRVEAQRIQIEATERAKAQAAERARADAEIAAATAKARAEAHAQAQAEHPAVIEAVQKFDNDVAAMLTHKPVQQEATTGSPLSPPTLRLGQICERLGFQVTADFLKSLGFEPAGRERAAVLFREIDFSRMCAVLVRHIQTVSQGVAA